MQIKAPAKLNLFLNITGKREDGYHLLESLFVPLKLADSITLQAANDIEVSGIRFPNNTALKAAELMRTFYNIKAGVRITIEKKIPIGAGLGGSATDAGALISALCNFWEIDANPSDLLKLALKIGADVPYFLNPMPAYVSGIGEVIKPANLNLDMHILVIYPGFELLAKDVYNVFSHSSLSGRSYRRRTKGKSLIFRHSEERSDVRISYNIGTVNNDLEAPAIKLRPEIRELLQEIKLQKGCKASRMSGSGSACFGIFDTENAALKAEKFFSRRYFTYYEHLTYTNSSK